jgi:DNA-binding IclR family transcriptional regulator
VVTGNEPTEARANGVQVISRAVDILRALQDSLGGLSQAELATRTGLARTTVHRILGTLEEEGLVVVAKPRGRYRLGPEIPRMADAAKRAFVAQIRPFLEELFRQVDETVDLSVLDHDQATFVDQVVAGHRLRAVSAVGVSFPLHCTANGKALLASLHPSTVAAILPPSLPALTRHTITSTQLLQDELERVREQGVAYDREEHTEGICAVGAVVPGVPGQLVAVSVPMPVQRFHGREPELAGALRACTRRIEAALEPPEPP